MANVEATGEEHVGMIERRERRLPELHRKYVRHSTRVRDLLELFYHSYHRIRGTTERWPRPNIGNELDR